jgi:5-methylcytosine-specific restriction protein A
MATNEDFQSELDEIFALAEQKRLTAIVITSGNLHRNVGEYTGRNHRMPICCNVMRSNMKTGDEIISAPPKGDGATLMIRYNFPR